MDSDAFELAHAEVEDEQYRATRERVQAYEYEFGCERRAHPTDSAFDFCKIHDHEGRWTGLGCPVAVAAARVEADQVRAAIVSELRESADYIHLPPQVGPGAASPATRYERAAADWLRARADVIEATPNKEFQ